MVQKSGRNKKDARLRGGQTALADWVLTLSAAVAEAQAALAAGDSAAAEAQARAISACSKAAREVAELCAAAQDIAPEEDVETIRSEIRRRVARYVVAEQGGATLEELQRIAIEGDAP